MFREFMELEENTFREFMEEMEHIYSFPILLTTIKVYEVII